MSGWENLVDKDTAQLLDENDEPEEEYANEFRFEGISHGLRVALSTCIPKGATPFSQLSFPDSHLSRLEIFKNLDSHFPDLFFVKINGYYGESGKWHIPLVWPWP